MFQKCLKVDNINSTSAATIVTSIDQKLLLLCFLAVKLQHPVLIVQIIVVNFFCFIIFLFTLSIKSLVNENQ